MIIKARGIVTVPRVPRSLPGLLRWARDVVTCLRQLRDRTWDVPARKGGGSRVTASYTPWRPTITNEGTGETPDYKAQFNLGSYNGVIASNWSDKHSLPNDETVRFVVITVTSETGKVTGVVISIDDDSPATDFVAKDTPPTEIKILLGAIDYRSSKMLKTTDLQGTAQEIYRESKDAPATGGEAFSRWWRWNTIPA